METSLELEIAQLGAQFTPLELKLPEGLDFDGWKRVGNALMRQREMSNWWLGDWAAFGERKYGDIKKYAALNGIKEKQIYDAACVSRSVESARRRADVKWSFYREVLGLGAKEQDRWINKVAAESLSVSKLRIELRTAKGEHNALASEGKSLKLLTKLFDDLLSELKKKPLEFWSPIRKQIWRDRLAEFSKFSEECL